MRERYHNRRPSNKNTNDNTPGGDANAQRHTRGPKGKKRYNDDDNDQTDKRGPRDTGRKQSYNEEGRENRAYRGNKTDKRGNLNRRNGPRYYNNRQQDDEPARLGGGFRRYKDSNANF